jgi:hypothetical protein
MLCPNVLFADSKQNGYGATGPDQNGSIFWQPLGSIKRTTEPPDMADVNINAIMHSTQVGYIVSMLIESI